MESYWSAHFTEAFSNSRLLLLHFFFLVLDKLEAEEARSNGNKLRDNTKEEQNQSKSVGSVPWAQSEDPKSSKTLFTSKPSSPMHPQIKNSLSPLLEIILIVSSGEKVMYMRAVMSVGRRFLSWERLQGKHSLFLAVAIEDRQNGVMVFSPDNFCYK